MAADSEPDFTELGRLLGRGPSDILDEMPSASTWTAIEAEIEGNRRRTNRRQRAAIAVVLAAAVLLVAVPLGLAARSYQQTNDAASVTIGSGVVDLLPIDGSTGPTGWAELNGRELAFGTDELETLEPGSSYEMWLLDAATDGTAGAPIWIGTVGAGGEFSVDESIDLELYHVVDISIEPDDGDATHSGDSVLRGSLAVADG